MAFSEDNQNWIDERIRQAVYPNGWKKFADRLRYWGVLGVMVTAFLSLIAIVVTLGIFSANKIGVESEFRGKTGERLLSIEGRLTSIETSLKLLPTQLAITKFSTTPRKELRDHKEELNQLRTSLTKASPVAPGYWNTAFQVIQLASKSTSDVPNYEKLLSMPASEISNVTSRPPGTELTGPNQKVILKNHVEGLVFRNSIIIFDISVELVNDMFIDCIFIFPALQAPSEHLESIGAKLLSSSDLSHVTLNPS